MKPLRDITPRMKSSMPDTTKKALEGSNSSIVVDGSIGTDPGVDYKPKSPESQKFVALHKTQKHSERTGNKEDVRNGAKIKYALKNKENSHMGRDQKESEKVYEEKKKPLVKPATVPNRYQAGAAEATEII